MRVLVLGGSGMLGHKFAQIGGDHFDTYVSLRQSAPSGGRCGLFPPSRVVGQVSAQDFDSVTRALAAVRPAVVVNCIGIVKQATAAKDPLSSIAVNALFPHRLAQLCQAAGSRLIHISTDCVFSGRQGGYRESDVSDAEDLYGRTKYLGEVDYDGCVTLRTSIIGRELEGAQGLIEWFLSRRGQTIRGYTQAIFSGLTTSALSMTIVEIIARHADMRGVWHVAADPISKFDLLSLVKEVYGLPIEIEPDATVVIDRSLNADRFRQATGLVPPAWREMIEQMYRDTTPYAELRRSDAD